ncbi:MAG: hypothetical protein ABUL73_05355 [Alphaproteobacteria bacterium]
MQARRGVAVALLAATIAVVSLSGCASAAPADTPAWFKAKLQSLEQGYPRLADVPRTTTANVDQNHWNQVQHDVAAAGQALRSNPRDEPAAVNNDAQTFMDEAHQTMDRTRAAHSADAPAATTPAPAH